MVCLLQGTKDYQPPIKWECNPSAKTETKSNLPSVNDMFKKLKKALQEEKIWMRFRYMPDAYGMVQSDFDGWIMTIDPRYSQRMVWSTILHEVLHITYPDWKHEDIYAAEKLLIDGLKKEQHLELMSLIGKVMFPQVLQE